MSEVLIDGLRVASSQAGAGPPLVLLHGGMDDSRSWRWQLEGLSDSFHVLAWDAPGCGRSSDPPERWRMPDFADCLAAWIGAMGVERPHVLGLSLGSSLALELYRRHPMLPASLLLASTYLGWAGSLSPQEVATRVERLLSTPEPTREQLVEDARGFVTSAAPPELVDELVLTWADNTATRHPSGYRALVHSMAEADLRDVPAQIRIPTLLLHGALDERAPLETATELHAAIPSSTLVVIPGAAHLCNAEAPETFNRHVREFVSSLAG